MGPEAEYSYITHLINQPPAVNDDSQWMHQAIHSVLSTRMPMPEAWQCVPSFVNRGKRSWEREVIVLGVLGPSGAGKTSLCQRLSHALNSPFEPISTDWYLRQSQELPRCLHRAADSSMQWSQERCYEMPSCYDLNGLHDELLKFVNHVAQCKKADLHPYYLRTPRRRRRRLQPAGVLLDNVPTYLIVEGFILFAEPAIVDQLNELVWLHVPWQISCERRYKRAGRVSHRDAFRMLYKEHVHAAHRSCQRLFRRNVAHRDVHEIDATGDADVVYQRVFACLTDPPCQDGLRQVQRTRPLTMPLNMVDPKPIPSSVKLLLPAASCTTDGISLPVPLSMPCSFRQDDNLTSCQDDNQPDDTQLKAKLDKMFSMSQTGFGSLNTQFGALKTAPTLEEVKELMKTAEMQIPTTATLMALAATDGIGCYLGHNKLIGTSDDSDSDEADRRKLRTFDGISVQGSTILAARRRISKEPL